MLVERSRLETSGKSLVTSTLPETAVSLCGHDGEVFVAKFSPDGRILATAGMDGRVMLWRTFGDCSHLKTLGGHKNAVLDLEWSVDGLQLVSASVDSSVCVWDVASGERSKKIRAHYEPVNCLAMRPSGTGRPQFASGSNDGTVKVWQLSNFQCSNRIVESSPVLTVCYTKDGDCLLTGTLDNSIKCWNLQDESLRFRLCGHTDSVTGLSLSPDGNLLQSTAMDCTVRIWDVKPFVPAGLSRNLLTFDNVPHGKEKNLLRGSWSHTGEFVAVGGADMFIRVYSIDRQLLVCQIPGHKGCINSVAWHPSQLVVASCSSDGTACIGRVEADWLEPDNVGTESS